MKSNELRKLDIIEVKNELFSLLKEQFNLRLQLAIKQPVKSHNLRLVRRKIARVKSILQEKNGTLS